MDKSRLGEMLRRLVTVDSPSGHEGSLASLVAELAAETAHEVRADAMGNVICLRKGAEKAPGKIMLAAHADEIGMRVTKVERGFLHVTHIGGLMPGTALGQEVTVYPSGRGSEAYPGGLRGYVGSRPPHVLTAEERKRAVTWEALRVDTGLPVKLLEDGLVRVGDVVALRGPYQELLGGRIASKAMDNRTSVAVTLGALGYLAGMSHTWDVLGVATAQEEVGLKGAATSAYSLQPDLALVIDVTHGRQPGVNGDETVEMDEGPALAWGPNVHPAIVKKLRAVADALEIPYVTEPIPGASGTDAWAIQVTREGIPTGVIGVPLRYMHSPTELVVLADLDRAARLVAAFTSQLDDTFLRSLAEEV